MYQILLGSFILSIIHAAIPNHWLPIITLAKTEGWSEKQSIVTTVITGISHTLSTVIIGIIVGITGYTLASNYEIISRTVAPAILLILGLLYIVLDFRANQHHSHKAHFTTKGKQTKYTAILISLSLAMFLTPCAEVEAYYFQAGTRGWTGIAIVSLVYVVVTLLSMLLLVYLGLKGMKKFNFHFLEHHEKLITGLVLCILGLLAFFVQ